MCLLFLDTSSEKVIVTYIQRYNLGRKLPEFSSADFHVKL